MIIIINNSFYNHSKLDTPFEIWSECFCTSWDEVAVMVCVAINGFHSQATYRWFRDAQVLEEETYPVLYASAAGTYKGVIEWKGNTLSNRFRIDR